MKLGRTTFCHLITELVTVIEVLSYSHSHKVNDFILITVRIIINYINNNICFKNEDV